MYLSALPYSALEFLDLSPVATWNVCPLRSLTEMKLCVPWKHLEMRPSGSIFIHNGSMSVPLIVRKEDLLTTGWISDPVPCSTCVTYIYIAQKWSLGIGTGILVSLLPVQCTDGFLPAEWLGFLPMCNCQHGALPKGRPFTWNCTHLGAWAWKTELTPLSLNNAEIHIACVDGRLTESLPNCQTLSPLVVYIPGWRERNLTAYSYHAGGSRWLWGIPCAELEKVLQISEKHKNQANWILHFYFFFLAISYNRETVPHFLPQKSFLLTDQIFVK